MSDSTRINELRKEIEALCDNCDRPNKEETGKIILSAMVFGFGEGLKVSFASRPQGKWNRLNTDTFHCKLCGRTFIMLQGQDSMNFCPNCGAKMEGIDDD